MFDVLPAVVYVPPEYLPSVLPRICIRARLLCGRLSGDDRLYGQCSPARTRRERAGLQGRREHQRGRDATLGRLGVGDSEQRLVTQQPQQLELGASSGPRNRDRSKRRYLGGSAAGGVPEPGGSAT